MPWVKISSETHKDMKQFLVDVDGLSLGELVESAFEYCMENIEDSSGQHEGFEKFLLVLEEAEDESEEDKQDEEEESDKEGESEQEEASEG